jgi:hypothetical protein
MPYGTPVSEPQWAIYRLNVEADPSGLTFTIEVTGTGTESIGDGVFQQVVDLFEASPDFNVVGAGKTFNTSQGVTPSP